MSCFTRCLLKYFSLKSRFCFMFLAPFCLSCFQIVALNNNVSMLWWALSLRLLQQWGRAASDSERDEIWWIMQRGLSFSLTIWNQPGENCKRSTSQRSHHKSPSLPPRGPPGPRPASQEPPSHPFQTVILGQHWEACRSVIHGTLGSCQDGGGN